MNLLADFIQAEADANLWEPEVRDLHLWVTLRSNLSLATVAKQLGHSQAHAPQGRLSQLSLNLFPNHLQTLRHLMLSPVKPKYDAFIFKLARNYHIYRYYYERIPQPLILDIAWHGKKSVYAWQTQSTVLFDTLGLMSSLSGRRIQLSANEEALIRDFAHHVTDVFDIQHQTERWRGHILRSVKSAVVLRRLMERFVLPRLRGQLALVHQAYYLKRDGVITRLLREHDITVAEPQHGVIYSNHFAYNFSQSAIDNPRHPLHLYKPDVLLSFGEFWGNQIQHASRIIPIGYPHLSEKVRDYQPHPDQANYILIVSQGTFSQQLSEITQALAQAFPKHHIIYKLHPAEIGLPDRYANLRTLSNVQLIEQPSDIHQYIAKCQTIIGGYSTVLFEVLAYPDKRLFMLEHYSFDEEMTKHLGVTFQSSEELIDLLKDETIGFIKEPESLFWNPNWEQNINEWIKSYLG